VLPLLPNAAPPVATHIDLCVDNQGVAVVSQRPPPGVAERDARLAEAHARIEVLCDD